MIKKDYIKPFILANHIANGRFVDLSDTATEILKKHNYPDSVSSLLLELMVISCFLGQNLKQDGSITCQIQGLDGIIRVAVAEYSFGGNIRACASFNESKTASDNESLANLIGSAHLVVSFESENERYQGIINLDKDTIAMSFKDYLTQSEQIEAELHISTSIESVYDEQRYRASGIILKKMPTRIDEANQKVRSGESIENDEWEKFPHYINSLSKDEILNNECEEILNRLFHECGVITYDNICLKFNCRCSREKMEKALQMISPEEIEQLKIDGKISIKCQFCGESEIF